MDNLPYAASAANRPIFQFSGHETLTVTAIPEGQFGLTGPAEKLDDAHWPVRGDLAHICLAGRWFVPHYAVPMPHSVTVDGTELRQAGKPTAEVIETLTVGTEFNVLDIAGGWAWGQVGEDGCVGYVPLDSIQAA